MGLEWAMPSVMVSFCLLFDWSMLQTISNKHVMLNKDVVFSVVVHLVLLSFVVTGHENISDVFYLNQIISIKHIGEVKIRMVVGCVNPAVLFSLKVSSTSQWKRGDRSFFDLKINQEKCSCPFWTSGLMSPITSIEIGRNQCILVHVLSDFFLWKIRHLQTSLDVMLKA